VHDLRAWTTGIPKTWPMHWCQTNAQGQISLENSRSRRWKRPPVPAGPAGEITRRRDAGRDFVRGDTVVPENQQLMPNEPGPAPGYR